MHVTDARNLVDYLERFEITLSVMQTGRRAGAHRLRAGGGPGGGERPLRGDPLLADPQHPRGAAADRGGRGAAARAAARRGGLRDPHGAHHLRHPQHGSRDLARPRGPHGGLQEPRRGGVRPGGRRVQLPRQEAQGRVLHRPQQEHGLPPSTRARRTAPESIHQALHYCRAHRIGHGTRLFEDPDLLRYVRDFRIPIEICLDLERADARGAELRGAPGAALLRRGDRDQPEHRQPPDERHHGDGGVLARPRVSRLHLGRSWWTWR